MSNGPKLTETDPALATALGSVCMVTYVALILSDSALRRVAKAAVAEAQRDPDNADVRDKAVKKVTEAMTSWGFPQSTISIVQQGQLIPEIALYEAVPDALPDYYSM